MCINKSWVSHHFDETFQTVVIALLVAGCMIGTKTNLTNFNGGARVQHFVKHRTKNEIHSQSTAFHLKSINNIYFHLISPQIELIA